jgi:hypothetical protein
VLWWLTVHVWSFIPHPTTTRFRSQQNRNAHDCRSPYLSTLKGREGLCISRNCVGLPASQEQALAKLVDHVETCLEHAFAGSYPQLIAALKAEPRSLHCRLANIQKHATEEAAIKHHVLSQERAAWIRRHTPTRKRFPPAHPAASVAVSVACTPSPDPNSGVLKDALPELECGESEPGPSFSFFLPPGPGLPPSTSSPSASSTLAFGPAPPFAFQFSPQPTPQQPPVDEADAGRPSRSNELTDPWFGGDHPLLAFSDATFTYRCQPL